MQHFFLLVVSFFGYCRLEAGALLFGRKFTSRSCCLLMTSVFGPALMNRPGPDTLEVFTIRRTVTRGALLPLLISLDATYMCILCGHFGDRSSRGHFVSVQHRDAMQDVPVHDDRPCMVCYRADDEEHTLLCHYCDTPCHLRCTEPRWTKMPHEATHWYCNRCVFHLKDPAHYDISHDERVAEYKSWLRANSLPDLTGQRGIFFDVVRNCNRPGIILFPTWEELTTWWSDCWRRELWNDRNLPVTFVSWRKSSPYIFRFDDDGSADVLSYDQAIAVIRRRGRVNREPTPPPFLHPIFAGPIFR